MSDATNNWLLVNHLISDNQNTLTSISEVGNQFSATSLTSTHSSEKTHAPWFLGLQENNQIMLFDPEHKTLSLEDKMPSDAHPAYSYKDSSNNRIWFMNDGDKECGNDALNCGENGSTVTIFSLGDEDNKPEHIKTLCVGRGHHVTTFIEPTNEFPNLPKVAYVSNLLDGSISIVGNDANNPDTFLSIIHTINLCESAKEKNGRTDVPNNAFPHGKQYSNHTGKIYSLNNGYGTVAVIDPASHEIETLISLKGCSNILLSPCGKFIIGKGADRKTNDAHVLGRLSVIDASTNSVIIETDIQDFYPSTYRFSPDGNKLYVTSAATGKGIQKENLKINTLYIYDAKALPQLSLLKVIEVGNADCGRRPIAFTSDSTKERVFVSNPSDATVTVMNSNDDSILETVKIAEQGGNEFNFSFWGKDIYGA